MFTMFTVNAVNTVNIMNAVNMSNLLIDYCRSDKKLKDYSQIFTFVAKPVIA
jgi:hypothetical protein